MDSKVPDLDDIPDTRDLVEPTLAEMPRHILAHTLALRAIRKDLRQARGWFRMMVAAFAAGSATVVLSVATGIFWFGGEIQEIEQLRRDSNQHNERITHLERKAMDV